MMQASTSSYEYNEGYAPRRGHASQFSISDDTQHVTETIGYMYGDDYDKRDSKRLSYNPSSMAETLSVTYPHRENPPQSSDSNNNQRSLPIRTSSIDRSTTNCPGRQSTTEPGSSDRDVTGQRSPVLTRSPSTATSKSIPLNDLDYDSNPAAAVAQELTNLAALRRMSMDVGAADPDLPLFGSNFGVPPIPPSGQSDDDDASQLFWVPARLHPGLAPKEFKSFLNGKAEQIKRRSGELKMTESGLQVQGSAGGLRRKKSMLSRQIDTSGSERQNEVDQLESVSEEASIGQRRGEDSMADDRPILPAAPPGHSLRRSTRTTYRRGSFKTGDRIPYSRRALRQSDPDAEAVTRRSPQSGEEESPILGLTRVSTDPTHGNASSFSRSTTRSQPNLSTSDLSSSPEFSSDNLSSGNSTSNSQTRPSLSLNGVSGLETSTTSQSLQIIQPPPAVVKESPATITVSVPNHIPVRKSSHDPPPSQPPQVPLPPEPIGSRASKRAGIIRPAKESPQTIDDIASHPSALPGNNTRTDTLSFIPTSTDSSNRRSDSKKGKDKKDGDGGRKSSWTWLRGSEEKDKDKKKEDESKKSKGRMPKITEKMHDNTRLDLLQASIDGAQRGRESIVIDRGEVRLEDERRKDTAKRAAGSESKKEKEPSLFSSIFGSKKKGSLDHSQKKHSLRALSPEPLRRELKPDIDYNWTRFPISKEREIYRYAHWKLAEPKRALHSQVLLSNFMYSYLAKVQQMHPTLSISAPQAQHRKREHSQSEDHSQQHRHQSREHDHYNNGPYYNESHYDYDGDGRDDQQWSRSGGRGHSQNGSAHGSNQRPQYGTSRSSFGDEAQLDDDDDMW
ncbi:telomere silencing protein Zds1 [Histoplasma ohiense]|nr:telomere silencing protein Zds1 [Histoplasma ohiense (nom. inval.)]